MTGQVETLWKRFSSTARYKRAGRAGGSFSSDQAIRNPNPVQLKHVEHGTIWRVGHDDEEVYDYLS